MCLYSYYNKQWHMAQQGLEDLAVIELPPEPVKPEKVIMASIVLVPIYFN